MPLDSVSALTLPTCVGDSSDTPRATTSSMRLKTSSARRFPMTAISMRGHLQLRQDFPERLPVVVLPSCCEMGALRQGSDDPRERRGCIDAWTRSPTANMILFNILTSWLPSCLWPAQGAGCENFSRQTLYRNGGSGKLQSQCTNSRAPRRRRRPVSGGRTTGP
jgi:hypothetical protein